MSRDTLNGTLVSRFADFTGVSWFSALPQFVKTGRSDSADLACSQIGTTGLIMCAPSFMTRRRASAATDTLELESCRSLLLPEPRSSSRTRDDDAPHDAGFVRA